MKRFTLLSLLVALFSVTTFAQVAPPANATVETWYTADGKFYMNGPYGTQDFTSAMPTISVAIDGADIYIQGLAFFSQRDGSRALSAVPPLTLPTHSMLVKTNTARNTFAALMTRKRWLRTSCSTTMPKKAS